MAEVIGAQTILANALPTGVDGTRVARFVLRDGTTFQQTISNLAIAIGGLNTEFVNRYGYMMSVTEDVFMEYENGGAVTMAPVITDVSQIDAVGGTTIGHMIALAEYGRGIGGSGKYFRDLRASKLNADVAAIIRSIKWRFEYELMNRLFVNTEFPVGTGYNVPFVNGSGGNVDYTPPGMNGEVFTSTHTHYLGINTATKGYDDALEEMAEHLFEHGHEAPFTAIVSKTDVDAGVYHALADFVELKANVVTMIDRGGATSGAENFATGMISMNGVIGYYNTYYGQIDLKISPRVPTKYLGMFKSYGQLSPSNPLAVRVHPDVGFGVRLLTETTNDNQYPIKQVSAAFEIGVGVGMDRTNGVVAFVDSSGTWSNPTII